MVELLEGHTAVGVCQKLRREKGGLVPGGGWYFFFLPSVYLHDFKRKYCVDTAWLVIPKIS
ncbi:hypothetical protein AO268_17040 [Pseudomonas sp. ICMP 8385]|nr:hypothetical protein AO268_17040 [Pseudomonas sp. ICMP 8385]